MSEAFAIALAQFAVKFGLDSAIIFAEKVGKPGATIDDAILALRSVKTAQEILDETPGPTPPPAGPS